MAEASLWENIPELAREVGPQLAILAGGAVGAVLATKLFRSSRVIDRSNTFPEARAEQIMGYASTTLDYVCEKQIGAIALIDNAARPFHIPLVNTWWQRPDSKLKPRPPIFFLNPQGFQAFGGDIVQPNVTSTVRGLLQGDREILPHLRPRKSSALRRFAQEYPQLHELRTQPLLLIDTCIHSGVTLNPVLKGLAAAGFKNVHLGIVHYQPRRAGKRLPTPDLILDGERPLGGCYPFGYDRATTKTHRAASGRRSIGARAATSHHLRRNLVEAMSRYAAR